MWWRVGLVSLALLALVAVVDAQPADVTGNDYQRNTDSLRLWYTIGLGSGFTIARTFQTYDGDMTVLFRCIGGMTYGQLEAILDKYLADHPERWDHTIATITVDALANACAKR
jgi:hypothetical protein